VFGGWFLRTRYVHAITITDRWRGRQLPTDIEDGLLDGVDHVKLAAWLDEARFKKFGQHLRDERAQARHALGRVCAVPEPKRTGQ